MSRGEMLISMITSFSRNDREGFIEDCQELIAYEESKKNYRIASLMRKALEEGGNNAKSVESSFSITPIETNRYKKNVDNINNELIRLEKSYVNLGKIKLSNSTERSINSIIEQWEKRQKLTEYNLTPQNRILFHGPPGTGKTFTAYGIANALGYDIAYIRFDSLVSSYLGQTGTNLKEVFDFSEKNNCILLLDEIDAIGKKRDDQQELGELKRIVISLLQNLDKLPSDSLLIACTNHSHLLDTALWRRFDTWVCFDYPEISERFSILESRLSELNVKSDENWIHFWADVSEGLSPAILVQIIENGVRKWAIQNKHNLNILITEELIQYLNIEDTSEKVRVNIAKKLRSQSKLFSFSYLSNLLEIPKSTLHKRLKEELVLGD
ncbi:MAG: ATP-binding protein [Clostridiales bacterium]|nr:ATP-binding protein [Clostridiales bacterium]MCF8023613.1 ATP-binding protein [Clostridiales bacterium]